MYVLLSAPIHSQRVWRIRHNEELYEMYLDIRLSTYVQIKTLDGLVMFTAAAAPPPPPTTTTTTTTAAAAAAATTTITTTTTANTTATTSMRVHAEAHPNILKFGILCLIFWFVFSSRV